MTNFTITKCIHGIDRSLMRCNLCDLPAAVPMDCTYPPPPILTSEDVRRIVRDELIKLHVIADKSDDL